MAYAPEAHAEEVSPKAKGIIGGALLGAELVVVTEAIIGVRSPMAYGVGAGLGAVAGGFAGFGVEKANSGAASVVMLAGGIALIIPALVVTLNATSFQGDPNAREDRAPTNLPPADPGSVGGSAVTGPAPAPAPAGGGAAPATTPAPAAKAPPAPAPAAMLSLSPSQLRLGVPVPEAHNVFSTQERRQLGMAQVTELRLPVVNVTF
ncbi:MAG TPA: hypothetical protein PLR99_32180 [Polyangiaceae bacterium]|nr:hypothetical protein [Polyangiaceae bacterium]